MGEDYDYRGEAVKGKSKNKWQMKEIRIAI